MHEQSFDNSHENAEKEPEIFVIQIPALTKDQLQSIGKIFDQLNQGDHVDVDFSRKRTDAEYDKEIEEKLNNPERFHMEWRYGNKILPTAPQYPVELLNLNGNWLIASNEHTKEVILEELEGRQIPVLDVKQGGGEVLDGLDEAVKDDIRFRLKNSKTRPLNQWPGSPRR